MDVVETVLEFSFIQSKPLIDLIQFTVGALVLAFLIGGVIYLFKDEEYREFMRRAMKKRLPLVFLFFGLSISLVAIHFFVLSSVLGISSLIIALLVILGIGLLLSRKFQKEWKEFKRDYKMTQYESF